jgi:hypothetical protein
LARTLIARYVEQNGYAPPHAFVNAMMACPLPGTEVYTAVVAPFAE